MRKNMHVVCFDIDGTLIASAGFDGELYEQAVWDVVGVNVNPDWSQYKNVSDSGILEEILESIPDAEERHHLGRRVQSAFVNRTKEYVERNTHHIREIPGAKVLVETLREFPNVSICIATGGWVETAKLKLRAIGIDPAKIPMATCSDAVKRTDIMRIAESRATRGLVTRRTYFGDGYWDKKAAEELGYDFVAIGGRVDHHVSFQDLQDLEAILGQLRV